MDEEPKIPEWIRVLQDLIKKSKKTQPDEDADKQTSKSSPLHRP